PLVTVLRNKEGILTDVAPEGAAEAIRESFMHVEVDRMTDPAQLAELAKDIDRVLDDVRFAVNDWKKMRDKLLRVVVDGQDALQVVAGSSLGLLREQPEQAVASSFSALPPEVRAYARFPDLL